MQTLNFAKGHGTLNDFVILVDPDDRMPISTELVRWLCHRRAGIGGDGLLRAVRAGLVSDWQGEGDLWFMDYRNADGSVAEMCGNGLRVFVRHLLDQGLVEPGPTGIATRAGLRTAWPQPDGSIRISMGPATLSSQPTWIEHAGQRYQARTVDVGNPHAVVVLDDLTELARLDLDQAPGFDQEVYPHGVNVEFMVPRGAGDVVMRVHERGVGETMSCGTGVVAVAAAHLADRGQHVGSVQVSVPGGRLQVDGTDEQCFLTGEAAIIAHGSVVVPPHGVVLPG